MKAAPYITMGAAAGAMLGLLALPIAAGALPPSEADASDACVPGGAATAMPKTASEYARMCGDHVGVPRDGEEGRVPTGRVKDVTDDCLEQCVAKGVGEADCERACSANKTAKK